MTLTADEVTRAIWKKFHVKRHDTLPFVGWYNSTREHLDQLLGEVGYTYGAEVGVAKGHHAYRLFRNIPGLKLICVDPWTAYNRLSAEKARIRYELCLKRLKPYDVIYKKMESMEAVKEVPDGSLDFVYIDGLHEFDPVMLDLIHWAPKVRPGGIVAGHDYYHFYQAGIIHAVNTYTVAHNIHEWYVTRDKEASFFWVVKQ